jgi:hypothetical protein
MTANPLHKLPIDFADIREWRTYVRATASPEEVDYILARGRTALYVRFYEVRKQPFPKAFEEQLELLDAQAGPERANKLEELNARIFTDMTQILFAQLPQAPSRTESVMPTTPSEVAQELMEHLNQVNPFFSAWTRYEGRDRQVGEVDSLGNFIARELFFLTDEEVEFTLLMGKLGPLLRHYRDQNRPLPSRTRYSIWYLHYVEHPVRNAQTRALLGTLLESLESCGSA